MRGRRIVKWIFAFACTVIAGCGFALAGEGYGLYKNAVQEESLEETVAEIRRQDNFTSLEEMPETYVQAVVSVEDHRFYDHFGLDLIAIGRAVVNDIKAGRYVEGGSTITQQLAKNLYFSQEKTMSRKAAEVFLALEIEQKYTKDEMNDYECTLLAGVPNAPSKYAPSKNLALAEKRQQKVISRMEACGYITEEETTLMAAQLVALY